MGEIDTNSAEFYDNVYKEHPTQWMSNGRDEFAYAHLKEPIDVLDIGCGNGHTIQYLSNRWKNAKFYGCDISKKAIELAQKKNPEALFKRGNVWRITNMRMAFDLILLMGVAEHFEDLDELGAVKKLLAPNGLLYLEIPNCLSYSGTKEEGFKTSGRLQAEWHLTRESWERILKEQGYAIVESLEGLHEPWKFIWILRKE